MHVSSTAIVVGCTSLLENSLQLKTAHWSLRLLQDNNVSNNSSCCRFYWSLV